MGLVAVLMGRASALIGLVAVLMGRRADVCVWRRRGKSFAEEAILRVIARKGAERCGKPVRDPCAGAVPALLRGAGAESAGAKRAQKKRERIIKKIQK